MALTDTAVRKAKPKEKPYKVTDSLGLYLVVNPQGSILASAMRKARFWESVADQPLNERQRKVINRLLDGFEGKLTNAKWAARTKASADTALRDINDLVQRGILVRDTAGGRSTSYSLAPEITT